MVKTSAPTTYDLVRTPLQPGSTLIEAAAGTGKTYTIVGIVIRLLLEQNLPLNQILVVTFTEAATQELRDRLRSRLIEVLDAFRSGQSNDPFIAAILSSVSEETGDSSFRRAHREIYAAVRDFDEACVFTIHGFCNNVLQEFSFECGFRFDTELVTDAEPIVREAVEDFWRSFIHGVDFHLQGICAWKNLGPEELMPFVQLNTRQPEMVVAGRFQSFAGKPLGFNLKGLLEDIQKLWKASHDLLETILIKEKRWAIGKLKKNHLVEPAFRALEDYFMEGSHCSEAFAALEFFRKENIEKCTRKKADSPEHPFFDLCTRFVEEVNRFTVHLKVASLREVQIVLEQKKTQQNIQTFDDLLNRLDHALSGSRRQALIEGIRRQYQAVLIDEFQDTDPVQYRIFTTAFASEDAFLFFIGDPKQSVYGFRGADVFTYLKASSMVDRRYTLRSNWRSEPGLVAVVNQLFPESGKPFLIEGIHSYAVHAGHPDREGLMDEGSLQPSLEVLMVENQRNHITKEEAFELFPRITATEIQQLLSGDASLKGKSVKAQDIAVLVYENRQAIKIHEVLQEYGIASVLQTGGSLFDTREADEVYRVLKAVNEPEHSGLVAGACATDLMGDRAGCFHETGQSDHHRGERRFLFRTLRKQWLTGGMIGMFRSLLDKSKVRERLMGCPDGERRITNLLHLFEVLQSAVSEGGLGIPGLVRWFEWQLQSGSRPNEEYQLRLESDENAVNVVTVHKSKGLEYPIVFCPFNWRGGEVRNGEQITFHDASAENQLTVDLGKEVPADHLDRASFENLAESIRLLYVALTRAESQCRMIWGKLNKGETSALAFILHQIEKAESPEICSVVESWYKDADFDGIRVDLEKVCAEINLHGGRMNLKQVDLEDLQISDQVSRKSVAVVVGEARSLKRIFPRGPEIISFSSLTTEHSVEFPDRDHDETMDPPAMAAEGVFAFPKGTATGNLFHRVIELMDFEDVDSPCFTEMVRREAPSFGFGNGPYQDIVLRTMKTLVSMEFREDGNSFDLQSISRKRRLNEVGFTLASSSFKADALAACFDDGTDVGKSCHQMILDLNPSALKGFFKGFIDSVVEVGGRYYLFDWKTNWLGGRIEDYDLTRMNELMGRNSYFLQYHLYLVALISYLRSRLPGFCYAEHFGGVYYVFLRGIKSGDSQSGVFYDCPPESRLNRLESVIARAAVSSANLP